MRSRFRVALVVALSLASIAVSRPDFAGEYSDKKFLKGQGVFELSLEQHGNNVSIFFSAGYNDGHGAAPEADGHGTVTPKGTVEFKWTDSFNNAGSGKITRSGDGVNVSIHVTRIADPRCSSFYQPNIHLLRVKK